MPHGLTSSLTDEELDKLETLLGSYPEAMNIEMLDGFFAALVCSPELVMPSTYVPFILGTEESQFSDQEEAEDFYDFLLRHWNAVVRSLHEDEFYDLVVIEREGEDSYGNDWALGFMQGLEIGGQAWGDLLDDEEHGGVLVPILALAHEYDPDPEMRPEPIDTERRDLMLVMISTSLKRIFQYFEPHRRQISSTSQGRIPFRHASRKIGRNEPCPCGSNRKYKHCCGRN
ncbi:YecA family protein [Fundidesulfovibrio butyratiphilus]